MSTPSSVASCLALATTYVFRQPPAQQLVDVVRAEHVHEANFSYNNAGRFFPHLFSLWPLVFAFLLLSGIAITLFWRFCRQRVTTPKKAAGSSTANVFTSVDAAVKCRTETHMTSKDSVNVNVPAADVGLAFLVHGNNVGKRDFGMQTDGNHRVEIDMSEKLAVCRLEGKAKEQLRFQNEKREMEKQMAELRSRLVQTASVRQAYATQLQEQNLRLLRAVRHTQTREVMIRDAEVSRKESFRSKEEAEAKLFFLQRDFSALRSDLSARQTEVVNNRGCSNHFTCASRNTQLGLSAAEQETSLSESIQQSDISMKVSDNEESSVGTVCGSASRMERKACARRQGFEAKCRISRVQWHVRRRRSSSCIVYSLPHVGEGLRSSVSDTLAPYIIPKEESSQLSTCDGHDGGCKLVRVRSGDGHEVRFGEVTLAGKLSHAETAEVATPGARVVGADSGRKPFWGGKCSATKFVNVALNRHDIALRQSTPRGPSDLCTPRTYSHQSPRCCGSSPTDVSTRAASPESVARSCGADDAWSFDIASARGAVGNRESLSTISSLSSSASSCSSSREASISWQGEPQGALHRRPPSFEKASFHLAARTACDPIGPSPTVSQVLRNWYVEGGYQEGGEMTLFQRDGFRGTAGDVQDEIPHKRSACQATVERVYKPRREESQLAAREFQDIREEIAEKLAE